MKKITSLIALSFFTLSGVFAQTDKNKFPSKPSEQQEIKADKLLEREIQQKQLLAKPERLEDGTEKKSEAKKNQAATTNRKTRCNKSNCLNKKKS